MLDFRLFLLADQTGDWLLGRPVGSTNGRLIR